MRHTAQQKVEPGPRWRDRLRRAAVTAGGVLAVGMAVAGCGGGSSTSGVPTVSTATSTTSPSTSPSAGGSAQATGLLAYASCMRSHGVPNFPDPSGSEGISKEATIKATQEVSTSQAAAAEHDCKRALPAGESLSGRPSQTVTAQDQQYYLKAAACMRSHGIANFPDPSFSNRQVEFHMLEHIVDIHSTQFTQAYRTCRKLIPAGLPDSGPGT
jgi:hypothetical protein